MSDMIKYVATLLSAAIVLSTLWCSPSAKAVGWPVQQTGPDAFGPGDKVVVSGTQGNGLRLRAEPSLTSEPTNLLADGTSMMIMEGPLQADGYHWYRVRFTVVTAFGPQLDMGWVAGTYLEAQSESTGPIRSTTPPTAISPSSPQPPTPQSVGRTATVVVPQVQQPDHRRQVQALYENLLDPCPAVRRALFSMGIDPLVARSDPRFEYMMQNTDALMAPIWSQLAADPNQYGNVQDLIQGQVQRALAGSGAYYSAGEGQRARAQIESVAEQGAQALAQGQTVEPAVEVLTVLWNDPAIREWWSWVGSPRSVRPSIVRQC